MWAEWGRRLWLCWRVLRGDLVLLDRPARAEFEDRLRACEERIDELSGFSMDELGEPVGDMPFSLSAEDVAVWGRDG